VKQNDIYNNACEEGKNIHGGHKWQTTNVVMRETCASQ